MNNRRIYFTLTLVVITLVLISCSQQSNFTEKSESIIEPLPTQSVIQPSQIGYKTPLMRELEEIVQQIRSLGENKDLNGLVELENKLNAEWVEKDVTFYSQIMRDVCGAYLTYDFDNDEQYVSARKCVMKALRKFEQMPIGNVLELVALLGGDAEYVFGKVPENKWEQDRGERTKIWCRAWQKLESEIDENYDLEKNRPIYKANMTDEERKKAEKYNQQSFLQRDRKSFLPQFQKYLIWAYSKHPYNIAELDNYLDKYVSDTKLRNSILTDVRQRIKEQNSQNKK